MNIKTTRRIFSMNWELKMTMDDCEGDGDCEVESEEDENAIDEILVK